MIAWAEKLRRLGLACSPRVAHSRSETSDPATSSEGSEALTVRGGQADLDNDPSDSSPASVPLTDEEYAERVFRSHIGETSGAQNQESQP